MCEKKWKIFLVGIGMGSPETMTVQAREAVRSADCLIGAQRMLDAALGLGAQGAGLPGGKPVFSEYRGPQIVSWLREHPQYRRAAVLFSGDTGFYSGAKELAALAERELPEREVCLVPGIASAAYLAARLGTSWEDAALVSLHGQERDFIRTVSRNRKTFLLLGGKGTAGFLLARLREYDMDDVTLHVGRRLSYPDESVRSGRPSAFSEADLEGLSAVFVENPDPDLSACCHLPDGAFLRGKTPMTKEEVRAVCIAALGLTRDAVVYDVGAGTGSVSVEAARSGEDIRVYAVEKDPEAVSLIRRNRRKFRADGIRIVEGEAPGALAGLEPPTHVFIGGSSGNLREILKAVRGKNPEARIVLTAVSLETVRAVMEAEEEGLLPDARFTQITASRGRELGGYHMLTGMNPVYVVTAGGRSGDGWN